MLTFKEGNPNDATNLALILDTAGRRVPAYFWSQYAAQEKFSLNLVERKSVMNPILARIVRIGVSGKSIQNLWEHFLDLL